MYHRVVTPKHKKPIKFKEKIKLDIGCGEHPHPGFVGIDVQHFDDKRIIQHDLETYPWPLEDESVYLAMASHVVEHIDRHKFGFVKFMNEVWRICAPDAEFMISVPYAGSPGYWQDPTHVNPLTENTWYYFDPLAKDINGNLINFYKFYRPGPWEIRSCAWDQQGFMEVVLVKRRLDPSYGYRPGRIGGHCGSH